MTRTEKRSSTSAKIPYRPLGPVRTSETSASLARDATSIVSKSIGHRRGQRVTPTESIGPLLMAAAGLTSGLLAGASYWWLRHRP